MTLVELLAFGLIRAQVTLAGACLVVISARPTARRLFGAEATYRLWTLVPIAGVASVFPSLNSFPAAGEGPPNILGLQSWSDAFYAHQFAPVILLLWVSGALAFVVWVVCCEALFRRQARRGRVGPAVVGILWPRVYVPAGYEAQFTPDERRLIWKHERAHIERGDPKTNLLIAAMRAFGWFNPLAHIAAAYVRLDQEVACDALVVQWRPHLRRRYAEALLKAQLAAVHAPITCSWAATSGRHPLETRIRMLGRPDRGDRWCELGILFGCGLVFLMAVLVLVVAPHAPLLSKS